MKLSKKIMALLVAGTMSVSAFALAACDELPGDLGGDNGGTNTGNPDNPNNPSNPNNPDNPNNPSNPDNPGNPGNPSGGTTTETPAQKLASSLRALSFKALEGKVDTSVTTKGEEGTETEDIDLSMKVDLSKGDGDFAMKEGDDVEKFYLRGWHGFSEEWVYDFEAGEYKATGNLLYEGDGKAVVSEIPYDLSGILGDSNLLDYGAENAPMILGEVLAVLSSFADAADALTVTDAKATVNINLLAYNFASDLTELVGSVDLDTTISDILTSDYLKKYLMVFTEMLPVDILQSGLASLEDVDLGEIAEDLAAMLGAEEGDVPPAVIGLLSAINLNDLAKIKPDDKSTTYDYILKILGSSELATLLKSTASDVLPGLIGSVAGPDGLMGPDGQPIDVEALIDGITALTAIPLSFAVSFGLPEEMITSYIGMAQEMVSGFVEGNITKDSLTIPIGGGSKDSIGPDTDYGENSTPDNEYNDNVTDTNPNARAAAEETFVATETIKNMKLEIALSSGKVTGIKESADTVINEEDETITATQTAELKFVDSVTVENIDSKKVVQYSDFYYGTLYDVSEDDPVDTGYTVAYEYYSDDILIYDEDDRVVGKGNWNHANFDNEEYHVSISYAEYPAEVGLEFMLFAPSVDKFEEWHEYVTVYKAVVKRNVYEGTVAGVVAGEGLTEVTE